MRYLTLSLLMLYSSIAYCQKNDSVPEFGKITKTELSMSECDFDKNAEAVVLFDVEEVKCIIYTFSVYTKISHHIRIKILKDKGLAEADIKLPYIRYENAENIGDIMAQTYNLDGSGNITTIKLDKKAIYDKEISKRISQKIFTFPEVRVGSVIEYSYLEEGTIGSGLRNWNFQKSIPVKFSRYTMSFPEEIEIACTPICTLHVTRETKNKRGDNIQTFSMSDIPALRDEPFITCKDDYMQRIESRPIALNTPLKRISLTRSWYSIVNNLIQDQDFGQQLSKNIPRTDDLDDSLKKVKDPYIKMITIFHYVQKNMEWNGVSNIWALKGVKSAWKEKKGTAGEINLILINLLKDANIDAKPILVSTRENGIINTTVPGYGQFDKVLAYIKMNGQVYVLDATNKNNSPKLIPWEVMASEGLLINKYDSYEWDWALLWDEKQKFKDDVLINASVDDKGMMTGLTTVVSYDYSRSKRLPYLKESKEKFIEKFFTSQNPGIKVDSVALENQEKDTMPLVQKIRFSQPLNSSGAYTYFRTNLFTGLEKNPFISDYRFSDVFFGANQEYTINVVTTIPDEYSFDELPKNTHMIMPDTSISLTRIAQVDGGTLSMRIKIEFKKPYYSVRDYNAIREFYKKLFEFLNEEIVIKKNK